MPPISTKSRSFMRHDRTSRNFSIGVNMDKDFFYNNKPVVLREWIITFHNDKAVVGADKLNFKTLEEIKKIKLELQSIIESELRERELDKVQGILDIHPTGDKAEKSAHIHWWGSEAVIVASIIAKYVSENNLSRYRKIEKLDLTWAKNKDKDKTIEERQESKVESNIEKDELLEDIDNNLYFLKVNLKEAKKYIKGNLNEPNRREQLNIRDIETNLSTASRNIETTSRNIGVAKEIIRTKQPNYNSIRRRIRRRRERETLRAVEKVIRREQSGVIRAVGTTFREIKTNQNLEKSKEILENLDVKLIDKNKLKVGISNLFLNRKVINLTDVIIQLNKLKLKKLDRLKELKEELKLKYSYKVEIEFILNDTLDNFMRKAIFSDKLLDKLEIALNNANLVKIELFKEFEAYYRELESYYNISDGFIEIEPYKSIFGSRIITKEGFYSLENYIKDLRESIEQERDNIKDLSEDKLNELKIEISKNRNLK